MGSRVIDGNKDPGVVIMVVVKNLGGRVWKVLSRAELRNLNHSEVIKDPYSVLPCPGKALSFTHLNSEVSDAEEVAEAETRNFPGPKTQ